MAKPTELGEWATDPGQTIEPTAGQKALGFSEGDKPPARWINWLWNVAYQWHKYLNLEGTDELTYAAPRAREIILPITSPYPESPGWTMAGSVGRFWLGGTVGAQLCFTVEVPSDCTITKVLALVKQGGDGDGTPIQLGIRRITPQEGAESTVGTEVTSTAPGASGFHLLDADLVADTNNATSYLIITITISGSATFGAFDELHWVRVRFADPGPRNF